MALAALVLASAATGALAAVEEPFVATVLTPGPGEDTSTELEDSDEDFPTENGLAVPKSQPSSVLQSFYAPICQTTAPHDRKRCEKGELPYPCPGTAANRSGQAVPTGTGAWALGDDYVYFKDRGLIDELSRQLDRGAYSVLELGAGRGCYVHGLRSRGVVAFGFDGAPDIERQTQGLVHHADLTRNSSLGCADYVMSFEVAEHIPKVRAPGVDRHM